MIAPSSPTQRSQPSETPISTLTRLPDRRRQDRVAVRLRPAPRTAPSRGATRRGSGCRPPRASSAAAKASCSSDPVADEDELRARPPRRVAQHVPAATHALARLLGRAGQHRELLAGECQRHRPVAPLDGQRPGGRRSRWRRPAGRTTGSGSPAAPRSARPAGGSGRPRRGPTESCVQTSMTCSPASADRRTDAAHVVAERQERGVVRDEAAVVGDAVGDAAHRVLADPEPEVAAGLVGAEVRLALDVGQVRLGQVGGSAEQLGHRPGQRLDRVLRGVAGRDLRRRSRTS